MKSSRRRVVDSAQRPVITTARSLRNHALCQALESRRLLSVIDWTNKGTGAGAGDTDSFNSVYGANAAQARIIAQRAIDDWERVITNFNYTGGGNTFSLDLRATVFAGGLRGSTGGITRDSAVTRKPNSADIQLDDNGGGSGWYFDPSVGTPLIPDDGEFTSLLTPFDADANAVAGYDFYRTTAHEIGHALGLLLNTNGFLKISDVTTNLGIVDPRDGAENLYGVNVNGGASDYTLTSSGGGHLFEGGGSFAGPTSPNDLMNAGRNVPTGTRRLISDDTASLLRDVYAYTVTLPRSINTFYANLNRTTNTLVINGDLNENGSDADVFIVDVVGTDTRVRVGGTTELIPSAEYTSIIVNSGEANDILYIDALPAGKSVTVNGANGNDLIVFSDLVADLDSGILSDVSINGGAGTDSVRGDDVNDGIGGDTYTITGSSFTKNTFVGTLNADVELLTINGSNQPSTYNVNSSTFNLLINAGTGNDTLNVGSGDIDSNLSGLVTLNGGGGTDRLVLNDTTDGAGSDTWTAALGSLTKGARVVTYATLEAIVINASAQATTYNFNALGAGVPVTINGGGGNETFFVGSGDLDSNVLSNVTLNGGGGTDSITFEDQLDGTGGNIYTLISTQLNKGGRLFNYSGFESLVITGSATAATYNINGSSSATTIVNGGAAADTVNVGGGDVDTNLGTNITVNGGGGADALIFNDTTDGAGADTATFTDGLIVKGSQNFVYSSFATLVWNGAAVATTYNVNGTTLGTPVTVNGGAGNDTLTIGGGDFDTNINGNVDFVGNGGIDRLVVNDTTDQVSPLDTYTINATSFTKDSASAITIGWAGTLFGPPAIEQLVVNASPGANIINVASLGTSSLAFPPATPTLYPIATTINAGDGNDTITLGSGGQLTALRGIVSVVGGLGVDSLVINDSADTDNDAFTVTQSQVTNSDWDYAAQFNTTTDTVVVNAGTGNNAFTFNATGITPASVVLAGNAGVDNFDIVEGTATVRGGAGLDNVDVNATQVGTAGVVFDTNEDLASLYTYTGSTTTIATNGNIVIDTQSAGTLRGTFNINNNTIVDRTTSQSFLRDKIVRGYNGGTWNGVPAGGASGVITSATAAASALADGIAYATIGGAADQLNKAIFKGVSLNPGNVLITYTLQGDADIDRDVDFDDLLVLAKYYGQSPRNWVQGDWDYNTTTNFDDLLSLAKNYNGSVAAPPAPMSARALATRAESLRRSILGSVSDDKVI